ncbi:LOW QUALITY PROTEIN: sentrin-specific protease 7 [Pelodytes ibericus]
MDAQKKNDSTLNAHLNGRPPAFRIPKRKKTEDWSEDVHVTSPLSKLAGSEFRNETIRKRAWCSAYNSFNKMNPDSNAYYVARKYNRQPKILLTDVPKTNLGRRSSTNHINDRNSCNETNVQKCPISSSTSKNSETCPPSGNVCLDIKYVVEKKESLPSKACRDVSNTPTSLQKNGNSWGSQRSEISSKDLKLESKDRVQCNTPSPPGRTKHKHTYCHKWAEHLITRVPTSPVSKPQPSPKKIHSSPVTNCHGTHRDSYTWRTQGASRLPRDYRNCLLQKPKAPRRADHWPLHRLSYIPLLLSPSNRSTGGITLELYSTLQVCPCPLQTLGIIEKPTANLIQDLDIHSLDAPMTLPHHDEQSDRLCSRKLCPSHSDSESFEPVLLSSDEDEHGCGAIVVTRVRTVKKTLSEKHLPNVQPRNPYEIEFITEHKCVELKYMNVYFGKYKARATGCVRFSSHHTDIPLKVALQKPTCLSVDTRKVQQYGLWVNKGGEPERSRVIIFLWLYLDYAQCLYQQMGAKSRINTAARNAEHLFLELSDIPSRSEDQLRETIMEANKKGYSSLKLLSLEKAYPMLKNLCPEQNSFISHCFSEFQKHQQQPPSTEVIAEKLLKENKSTPSAYSVLHKCDSGRFSASLMPKQDNSWRPMRNDVPLQKFLVFPPPMKKGLGVTNEDLLCLKEGEFINDVIIDFYLKYLFLKKFPKAFIERGHIFSSLFFKCLTSTANGPGDKSDVTSEQKRHQEVKTWTRHVDIFSKDFIYVPVNENSHWKVEWEMKRKTARDFSKSHIINLYPNVPKQDNSIDCGMYLLQYVETFYQKPIKNFSHTMNMVNWFTYCLVKRKREALRDLTLKLHFQQWGRS